MRRRGLITGIAIAVVVTAAAAVVVGVLANRTPAPTAHTSVPPASSPTSSPVASDAPPTGCLGGTSRDAAMVLAAQKAAPHNSTGAVEVAAAFTRWSHQYPYPSAEDAKKVEDAVMSASVPESSRDLVGFFAGNPNASGGTVPDNTPYYFSTVDGVWRVDSYSDAKTVVSIGAGVVINGALNPSAEVGSTFTFVWEDGRWRLSNEAAPESTDTLFASGQPFTGGC